MNETKTWLILPMIAFSINVDKSKEITLGWLSFTYSIIF